MGCDYIHEATPHFSFHDCFQLFIWRFDSSHNLIQFAIRFDSIRDLIRYSACSAPFAFRFDSQRFLIVVFRFVLQFALYAWKFSWPFFTNRIEMAVLYCDTHIASDMCLLLGLWVRERVSRAFFCLGACLLVCEWGRWAALGFCAGCLLAGLQWEKGVSTSCINICCLGAALLSWEWGSGSGLEENVTRFGKNGTFKQ